MTLLFFILSFQDLEQKTISKEREVTVFFQHPIEETLVPIKRLIFEMERREDLMKQSLDQLAIPPKIDEATALWPSSLYVRELYMMRNGTVVVDLDRSFLQAINAGTTKELLMVYSMVHTLKANFVEIEAVQFLINGHLAETLLGQVDIEKPLTPGKAYLVDKNSLTTMEPQEPEKTEQTVQNH